MRWSERLPFAWCWRTSGGAGGTEASPAFGRGARNWVPSWAFLAGDEAGWPPSREGGPCVAVADPLAEQQLCRSWGRHRAVLRAGDDTPCQCAEVVWHRAEGSGERAVAVLDAGLRRVAQRVLSASDTAALLCFASGGRGRTYAVY
jgi:hypothetical protein